MEEKKVKWEVIQMSSYIRRNLSSTAIEQEFDYFKEYARRFDSNTTDKKYGILKQGEKPCEENMIYDEDTYNLRVKHLYHIAKDGGSCGQKQRKFLNWLEKAEGKQNH